MICAREDLMVAEAELLKCVPSNFAGSSGNIDIDYDTYSLYFTLPNKFLWL